MFSDIAEAFEAFCKFYECPPWIANKGTFYILFVGIGASIIGVLWKLLKKYFAWRNRGILNRDLSPFYSPGDVERATKYYIPTRYQNVSPSEDEEPGRLYIASAKNKLIPLFLKKAFVAGSFSNRYYMILADSGMGKTTFMINLFIAYRNQLHFPWSSPNYNISLLPLGSPNALNTIEKIESKERTILLLDAFDEDPKASGNYKKRMQEILQKTEDFKCIIITCRTQFFPSKVEEPYDTGYYSFGGSGEYKFQKLYISVFDDDDIKKYLRLRFSYFQFGKRLNAFRIAKKSPNLVMRPMLLNSIENLVTSDNEYEYTFQIYEELIDQWLDREANKPGIKPKYGDEFKKSLYIFSQSLAIDLYLNREARNGYVLRPGETIEQGILEKSDLDDLAGKTKSMLNRNAEGAYKFSHKSIMEYFLAKEFFEIPGRLTEFNFTGMDVVQMFTKEMLLNYFSDNPHHAEFISYSNDITNIDNTNIDEVETIVFFQYPDFWMNTLIVIPNLKRITFFPNSEFKWYYLLCEIVYLTYKTDLYDRATSGHLTPDNRRKLLGSNLIRLRKHEEMQKFINAVGTLGLLNLKVQLEYLISLSPSMMKDYIKISRIEYLNNKMITDPGGVRIDLNDFVFSSLEPMEDLIMSIENSSTEVKELLYKCEIALGGLFLLKQANKGLKYYI